jgi:hypothetical protein
MSLPRRDSIKPIGKEQPSGGADGSADDPEALAQFVLCPGSHYDNECAYVGIGFGLLVAVWSGGWARVARARSVSARIWLPGV